jgi:hypothetical protein
VRLSSRGDLRVRRPDHLRADVVSDRKERQFYYDGKTFTIFSPRIGHYASVPAPATIGELADQLEDRYGLMLPMVDLFRWGTDESAAKQITRAAYVEPRSSTASCPTIGRFVNPGSTGRSGSSAAISRCHTSSC